MTSYRVNFRENIFIKKILRDFEEYKNQQQRSSVRHEFYFILKKLRISIDAGKKINQEGILQRITKFNKLKTIG
jgi:hypothetical protein